MTKPVVDNSLSKMMSILDLLTVDEPVISAVEVMAVLGCSRTTAYRYLRVLADAGLLSPHSNGGFVLGARIIELDRQIRLSDPLLAAAEDDMIKLSVAADVNMFLSGHYRDAVICIAQSWLHPEQFTSWDRGHPMPLLRGAAGKVILANLPTNRLRNMMLDSPSDIAREGLGENWSEFRENLKTIRRQGYAHTIAEVDDISAGLATAIFNAEGHVIGSLVMAIRLTELESNGVDHYLKPLLETTARINTRLAEQASESRTTELRPAG